MLQKLQYTVETTVHGTALAGAALWVTVSNIAGL